MANVETAQSDVREVHEAFTFTIQVDVDPREVQLHYGSEQSAASLLKGEFESWLESLHTSTSIRFGGGRDSR